MRNLYQETSRPQIATARLEARITADVAIVGGGYSGLSTALHLAQLGLKAVVLEAHEIGHGCSGRNGGQVNPGLKLLPDDVEAHWGAELGARFNALSFEGPDLVYRLIEDHNIDCAPMRNGTIRAAIDATGVKQVSALVEQCHRRGAPVRRIDADEMRAMTGTSTYLAGAFDARGGHINPLAYARGLARAAIVAGAQVFSDSKVESVRREGTAWQIATAHGAVSASKVVIGTNGYTGPLWPGLARTIAPVYTYITATDPLPEVIRRTIMPCGAALFEAAWDVVYYRLDDEGRLVMGGRGPQRDARGPHDYRHLIDYAVKLWPQLQGVSWPWGWYGQVAITQDHFPHFTTPEPGAYTMIGYNGRGIAMATAAGRQIATLIASNGSAQLDIPLRRSLERMPFQPFWRLGANITMAAHELHDTLRGR